jgi:hypothetical protein
MEPESSLPPYSQELAAGPCPEPVESRPHCHAVLEKKKYGF